MTAPFDIFRAESNGSVFWIGSAASVAEAKARIREQSTSSAGEFLLLNQETGSKLVIKPDDLDAPARS
jgi:hypothetical protein